jgi:hypothetical protein
MRRCTLLQRLVDRSRGRRDGQDRDRWSGVRSHRVKAAMEVAVHLGDRYHDARVSSDLLRAGLGQLGHAIAAAASRSASVVSRSRAIVGDNAHPHASMLAQTQPTPAPPVAHMLQRFRRGLRPTVRQALWRVARPYARCRTRDVQMAAAVERLQADVEHIRKRHTEQIERLEELVRELVLTAESLRRAVAAREAHGKK